MKRAALLLVLIASAAAQDVDPEFEKSEKDAARPSKPAPSSTEDAAAEGVIEYNRFASISCPMHCPRC